MAKTGYVLQASPGRWQIRHMHVSVDITCRFSCARKRQQTARVCKYVHRLGIQSAECVNYLCLQYAT